MATLTQRIETVEERPDRSESILAAFMERTDAAIERLDHTEAMQVLDRDQVRRRRAHG